MKFLESYKKRSFWGAKRALEMDILFVTSKYYPHVGGVETQMRIVALELALQHRVEVATLGQDVENYMDGAVAVRPIKLSRLDRWRNLALRLLPKRYRRGWLGHLLYRSIYLPKLRLLIRGKGVVHALKAEFLSKVAEEAARAEGVPFVVTPYFHPQDNARVAARLRADVMFCKRAEIVFALLETDRQVLIDLGVEREQIRLAGVMPLLPEATDPEGFRRRYGLAEKPIILFLGRLESYKGWKALFGAAPRVWRDFPDAHFLFAGPASEEVQNRLIAQQDSRMRYLGRIDEQEKGDALAACDLFCMPSIAEILPAVYLEAWSCGKAVVGGTAHGLRELIEDNGAGITVGQDPELLADRLIELLRDEPLRRRMGESGRALVARRFSKAALVQAFEAGYQAACRQDAAAASGLSRQAESVPVHALSAPLFR
jgi:phosphatidyl-myo-inositol dimannoside synthase